MNQEQMFSYFGIIVFLFILGFGFPLVARAACCNADGDCVGGGCLCDSCPGCDCGGESPTECCRYNGDCKIGVSGDPEDCMARGYDGVCGASSCYCTSDCPSGSDPTHKECNADCQCVDVDGEGTDECSGNEDCYPCGTCIPCNCGISVACGEPETFEKLVQAQFSGSGFAFSEVNLSETKGPHVFKAQFGLASLFEAIRKLFQFVANFVSRSITFVK